MTSVDLKFSKSNQFFIIFRDSPGLIALELQNNPLSEITGHFLNCRTLHQLDLSNCGIRHLSTEFFHNTTNLNKLDLSNNPFGKIEPGPFDHLTNLEYLKLTSCNLTYISPEAFNHLENLRELELDNNSLRSLVWTSVLSPLIRLEDLSLRNTNLINLPGDAFAKNTHLRSLVLADNELWHLNVDDTLGHNLHNLQSLDLSNCNLKERLSEEAFKNASKLRVLNLSGNPMFASDLTAVLRHLPQLHKLSLSNCSLRKLPEAFENLDNLQELDVSHNPLEDAFVRLLNPLKSLEYLDMSYCSLGYVGNNTFAQMTSLNKLIMSGNPLHTLEQALFANLSRLNSLELSDCGLKNSIDPKVFGDRESTDIIELKLNKNPLIVPDQGPLLPSQLSNLQILDLSNCGISRIYENLFIGVENLTHLYLSNNKISGADNLSSLKKLPQLELLDLSNNNLSTVNPGLFESNPKILSLNLMNNPFVCNCSIADMWHWALQVKGDLDVLVGSQPSQFTTAKIRRTLSCSYEPEMFKNMMDPNKRPPPRKGDLTPNRTWAKYIKESNCTKKSS